LIPGPDSDVTGSAYSTGSPYNRAFFAGNIYNGKIPANPWDLVQFRRGWTDEQISNYKQSKAFETGPVTQEDARTAYQRVLKTGGASLPKRDAVDMRIVKDVKQRTGRIIKSQKDVGGWPTLKSAPVPADIDQDGMPDAWETQYQLDPAQASDGSADADGDGYTNVEEYLNGTNPREKNDSAVL
jgi:pectate lyase